jgi:hypothetical protein
MLSAGLTSSLTRERFKYYYKRNIKYKILRYPLCLVLGHDKYETVDWSYNATMCARCNHTLRYQRHTRHNK